MILPIFMNYLNMKKWTSCLTTWTIQASNMIILPTAWAVQASKVFILPSSMNYPCIKCDYFTLLHDLSKHQLLLFYLTLWTIQASNVIILPNSMNYPSIKCLISKSTILYHPIFICVPSQWTLHQCLNSHRNRGY